VGIHSALRLFCDFQTAGLLLAGACPPSLLSETVFSKHAVLCTNFFPAALLCPLHHLQAMASALTTLRSTHLRGFAGPFFLFWLQGALVVNYPFDNTADGSSVYSKAQDDAALRYLAKVYANRNPQLKTSTVRRRCACRFCLGPSVLVLASSGANPSLCRCSGALLHRRWLRLNLVAASNLAQPC
jgi:hypothetical protein